MADHTALLLLGARAVAAGALDSLRRMPMLLLDVPIADPATASFVDALTAASPAVLVTVAEGDDATLEAVRDLGVRRGVALPEAPAGAEDGASDLARARALEALIGRARRADEDR